MTSTVFYEEKQVNAPWMGWIVVFGSVGMLAFVLVELSNRWNTTGSVAELIAGALGVVLIGGTIAWLAFTHHLQVTIGKQGISYTYVPSFYEAKRITADQLESFELRKMTVSEMFATSRPKHALAPAPTGFDFRRKDKNKEVCTVNGSMVADLTLRDGRHVVLGTQNPDGMLWALKRLQSPS